MSFNYLLDTKNPDKELEFFWLGFKNSIQTFLDDDGKKEIEELSNQLNNLQKDEKYDEIEIFIKNHVEKIGYKMIEKNNGYWANILNTNIKRWIKLLKKDIFETDNVFYILFGIFNNCKSGNKNQSITYEKVQSMIIDYSKTKDFKILYYLMNFSIENELFGVIDKLRLIIDIEPFLKNDLINEKNKKGILISKPRKLIKFIESLDKEKLDIILESKEHI